MGHSEGFEGMHGCAEKLSTVALVSASETTVYGTSVNAIEPRLPVAVPLKVSVIGAAKSDSHDSDIRTPADRMTPKVRAFIETSRIIYVRGL